MSTNKFHMYWQRLIGFLTRLVTSRNTHSFVLGGAITLCYEIIFGKPVFAFSSIQTAICGAAEALVPVGIAIGFLVLVAGFILVQVGNRAALGRIAWSIIGVVALASIVAIFTALTGQTC